MVKNNKKELKVLEVGFVCLFLPQVSPICCFLFCAFETVKL